MSNRQAAGILGLVNAALLALVAFDVALTLPQQVAIVGLANAALSVVALFWPAKE